VCTFTNTSTLAPTLNCNDNATVSVKVTVSDGINSPVSDTATVTILNVAPIVATPTLTPNPANIGASVSLGTTFVDPGVNDTHLAIINWGDATTTSGTVSELLGSGSVAGNHAYAAAGNYTVTVTVNDNDGGVGTATANVVVGSPVTANAGGPYSGFEGSPVNLSGSVTNPGGGPLGISWTITWVGSAGTTCGITGSTSLTPAVTCDDNATVTAELSASDGVSPPATSTATVNIANVAPTIGSITLPVTPIPVNTAIALSATFGDVGTHDTHTATINWGDAAATTGSVTEANGSGTVTGSHPYAAAGTYTVSVTVVDDDSGSVIAAAETYVVVYDPSAGFVTGGGWISSPSGAYTPGNTSDTDYTGKANFGFVSKYLPGSTTPSGNTEFDLKSAGLNFHATGMTYLVVTNNATKAYYAGTGTVNGSGSYGFFVSVLDNGNQSADTFRIKVWNTATNAVVYDNQAGGADTDSATQQISGGSVVIHG
jgi:PKD repeat protein